MRLFALRTSLSLLEVCVYFDELDLRDAFLAHFQLLFFLIIMNLIINNRQVCVGKPPDDVVVSF